MSAEFRGFFWLVVALLLVVTGTFPLWVSIVYLVAVSVILVLEVRNLVKLKKLV